MSQSQALTTTQPNAVAVSRPASTAAATVRTIEAVLRPPGSRDLITSGPLAGYSQAMVDAVTKSVAKGAPPEELYRFFVQAIRYNLDPLAREIWCVNMAGKDQTPQWTVMPSRDGYRRAAKRNPMVADVRSGLVRDGDDFTYDGAAGTYVHKVKITAKKGAIIGAYCQIVMADGRKHVEFFYLDEVKRSTPVWQQFPDRMVIAAAERTMIKRHVGMSDLYVDDAAYERLAELESSALLVNPIESNYVDGFAVGVEQPQLAAGAPADTGPDRTSRNDGVAALNARLAEISQGVEGASRGDVLEARTAWLKQASLPPISKIDDAAVVWGLVDSLDEVGAPCFAELVVQAREARWQKEALAKEQAEAGGKTSAPVNEGDVAGFDDEPPIPDNFDDAPLLNGGAS